MIKKGVYAAALSVLNDDCSLDVDATIRHANQSIKKGLHGVFFFGSTGQSQLISISEKKSDFVCFPRSWKWEKYDFSLNFELIGEKKAIFLICTFLSNHASYTPVITFFSVSIS